MKAYSIFDDFGENAIKIIMEQGGIQLTVHPLGVPRPENAQLKRILEAYDCIILGTSQKITSDMFVNIHNPRIIATVSVGVDHIHIPEDKKHLVSVINTPKANAQSVAEYTIACALSCCKRFQEGSTLYRLGKDNKHLLRKPVDLSGKTIGMIGAGNISAKIMEYAHFMGMNVICWTPHPEKHYNLVPKETVFVQLEKLVAEADVISVNLPNNSGTKGIISESLIKEMKKEAVFISVSRIPTVNIEALFEKALKNPSFYVCLDIDLSNAIVNILPQKDNIMVTPHIAGGTYETRKRMFEEIAQQIIAIT